MSTLARLQQRFQQLVLAGEGGHAQAADGSSDVSGPLEIYIHAYQGRMRQALASNFPVLHRALGDEAFGTLARLYCVAHPSQHRSIRWLGDGLVDFLAADPGLLPHPALLDIARMDWAMRAAFDAADTPCLRPQDLQAVTASAWAALTFQTVPSFQLLQLQWGVEHLWHALNADAQAQTREPEPAAHALLVWRQQLECRWRSVDASEHLALSLLQGRAHFADLCSALQHAGVPAPEQRAATLLRTWVEEGLLARAP